MSQERFVHPVLLGQCDFILFKNALLPRQKRQLSNPEHTAYLASNVLIEKNVCWQQNLIQGGKGKWKSDFG